MIRSTLSPTVFAGMTEEDTIAPLGTEAQAAMGDLYYQKGVHRCTACSIEPELVRSYTWYRLFEKSARYDGERAYAKAMLERIRAEMTKEQIARGDERVSEWKDCGAR